MKDFDEARTARQTLDAEERSFRIGGEKFTIRAEVRADALASLGKVTDDSNIGTDVAALNELIFGCLEDEGRPRYLALREREQDPLTFGDLVEVSRWIVQTATARPTVQPSPSTAGLPTTGTPLTDESPLRAVTSTG